MQYLAQIGEAGGADKGFRVVGATHQGVQEQVPVGGGQLTQLTGSAYQRLTNLKNTKELDHLQRRSPPSECSGAGSCRRGSAHPAHGWRAPAPHP